ncbi:MAG: radical SAM protein [Pseudomonadota bacterium]
MNNAITPAQTKDGAIVDQAPPKPFVIVWRVLEQCNLSCPFCAYDKRLAFPRRVADRNEVNRMVRLLADWQGQTNRPVLLSWLGGEPTLWRDLDETSALAASGGLLQGLTTNGTTLGSKPVRDLLLSRFANVTFSIDGFGGFHDPMRGWKGAFAKLRRNITRLQEDKLSRSSPVILRANVVLMHQNLADFPALCRELATWGIREITFNQLGESDRPEFYPAHKLQPGDVSDLRHMLPDLRAELSQAGTTLLGGDQYITRIAEIASGIPFKVGRCGIARDFWFVDEAGAIAPCSFVRRHFGLTINDIRTVRDIARLGNRLCAFQHETPASECGNCMSTQQFSKFDL